jgi:phosphohistidine phosphatase
MLIIPLALARETWQYLMFRRVSIVTGRLCVSWRLYFLRHGIASDFAEDGSFSDERRPLTDVGRHRTSLVARSLKKMDAEVDVIFHSPYLRAQETAQIAAHELGVDNLVETETLFPSGSSLDLERLLSEEREVGQNVMLVGHQPNMSVGLAWATSGDNGAMMDMKKAGLACVRFLGETYRGPGVLEWLMTPKWVSFIFPDEKW